MKSRFENGLDKMNINELMLKYQEYDKDWSVERALILKCEECLKIFVKRGCTFKNENDLESLINDSMVKAMNTFNFDKGCQFSTWLCRIFKWKISDYFKRENARKK